MAHSVSTETQQALDTLGLTDLHDVYWNCSMPVLVEEAIRRLRTLCEIAEPYGIRLAHENEEGGFCEIGRAHV